VLVVVYLLLFSSNHLFDHYQTDRNTVAIPPKKGDNDKVRGVNSDKVGEVFLLFVGGGLLVLVELVGA
jgi:hypothetical protein